MGGRKHLCDSAHVHCHEFLTNRVAPEDASTLAAQNIESNKHSDRDTVDEQEGRVIGDGIAASRDTLEKSLILKAQRGEMRLEIRKGQRVDRDAKHIAQHPLHELPQVQSVGKDVQNPPIEEKRPDVLSTTSRSVVVNAEHEVFPQIERIRGHESQGLLDELLILRPIDGRANRNGRQNLLTAGGRNGIPRGDPLKASGGSSRHF